MPLALLTIIIPTYNRANHLNVLLTALHSELQGLEPYVEVLVSDNASTDSTSEVTSAAAIDWPALTIQRHMQNLGADGNFLSCISRVSTRYFWMIGDDDCPKRGVLKKVLRLLIERTPALLYMESEWVYPLEGPDQGETIGALKVSELSALKFAEAVHVFVTFISGMVVDKYRLHDALGDSNIDRFNSTSLVQLGWILPLFKSDGPFVYIANPCILATKNNSGGYGLVTVFGVNFTRIVHEVFGKSHAVGRALIIGNITQYLPGRIWESRTPNRKTAFTPESQGSALKEQMHCYCLYWLLLMPLDRFPRWLAQPLFQLWRVMNRLRQEWRKHFGG